MNASWPCKYMFDIGWVIRSIGVHIIHIIYYYPRPCCQLMHCPMLTVMNTLESHRVIGCTHTRKSCLVPYSSMIAHTHTLCRLPVLTLGNLHWAWVRLPLVHIGCVSVHVSVSAPKHLYHGLSTPLRSVLRPRNVLGHRTDGLVWVCPECFCNRGWLCIYCFVCLRHFVILNPSPEPCPKWFISVPIAVVLKRVYAYP